MKKKLFYIFNVLILILIISQSIYILSKINDDPCEIVVLETPAQLVSSLPQSDNSNQFLETLEPKDSLLVLDTINKNSFRVKTQKGHEGYIETSSFKSVKGNNLCRRDFTLLGIIGYLLNSLKTE